LQRSAADSKQADFGRILFDFDLVNGVNMIKVSNAPQGGIRFAGVRQDNAERLVTSKDFARSAPFKVMNADRRRWPDARGRSR
jgi:hypothetical protein